MKTFLKNLLFLLICVALLPVTAAFADGDIVDTYLDPDLDSKPMARFWFQDAMSGAIEDDLIEETILGMAEGGMGGVEVQFLGSSLSNEEALLYGWGSENWRNTLKKIYTAAASVEDGFKVDLTITSSWPPMLYTIDPNDDAAASALITVYEKVTEEMLASAEAVDVPKDDVYIESAFIFVDKYLATTLAQVVGFDDEGQPIFSFDSLYDLTDATEMVMNEDGTAAGWAAGVPDLEALETFDIDIIGGDQQSWGMEEEEETDEEEVAPTEEELLAALEEKFCGAEAMNDWQYLYSVDLSTYDFGDYQPSEGDELAVGDYVLFGSYYRGTGEGGSTGTQAGRAYVTNYFNEDGYQAIFDFWDEYILDDELIEMMQATGGSIFEDSIESDSSYPYFSSTFVESMSEIVGYDVRKYLPVIASGQTAKSFTMKDGASAPDIYFVRNAPFTFDTQEAEDIVLDYYLTLGQLFEERSQAISEWASEFNYNFRCQAYVLPGLTVNQASISTDVTEGDNSTHDDALRQLASVVNMKEDETIVSSESCTVQKMDYTWRTIMEEMNDDLSAGVNRVIFHGSNYPIYIGSDNDWPGWGWGGTGVTVFGQFNSRNAYWEDAEAFTGYISRVQAILQSGTANVDVAGYLDTEDAPVLLNLERTYAELMDVGYSYNVIDEHILTLDTAVCTDGVLAADGPSYRAIIMEGVTWMDNSTVEILIGYAQEGLTIIFNNCDITATYGTGMSAVEGNEDNTQENMLSNLETLMAMDTVYTTTSNEEVLATLTEAGITPACSYEYAGIEVSHRVDEVADYYVLYNSNEETATFEVTLTGEGVPYYMDLWTGEITPIAQYDETEDGVTFEISIYASEIVAYAVAPDSENFTAPAAKADMSDEGDYAYEDGQLVLCEYTEGFTIDSWDLSLESWGPDEEANETDPTISAKTTVEFEDVATGTSWADLPDTYLAELGVDSMADVSGIGVYTATFTIEDETALSAYIMFTYGDQDMLAEITVNGVSFPAINALADKLDLGSVLQVGENVITVKIDTTLANRISAENDAEDRWTQGLMSFTVVPYATSVVAD